MSTLIKNATVIDNSSKWNGKKVDILIHRGKIEQIAKSIKDDKATLIKGKEVYVSKSWIDIGTRINEPGFEHRETLDQLAKCAHAGGFGTIAPFPNTNPPIDNKSAVKFLTDRGSELGLQILPLGAVSQGTNGKDLAELIDLHRSGCPAFSDGIKGIQDPGLLLRALQYVKSTDTTIINAAMNSALSNGGSMHEGIHSTNMGTRGIPAMAEHSTLAQQISIQEYTQSKLCLYGVSTKESVAHLKNAKKKGLHITSSVPYLNLIYTDENVFGFDINLKVMPPLRAKDDQNALIKGLNEGTIDIISSNHTPKEIEAKDLEFAYAGYGATGLETLFSALNTHCPKLKLESLIGALTDGPAQVLKLEQPPILKGNLANITVFDTESEFDYNQTNSASKNNPFLGTTLKGKVLQVIG